MKTIDIDKAGYLEFKVAYERAVKEGLKVFVWHGEEFLTGYAKYLVEYLNDKFKEL